MAAPDVNAAAMQRALEGGGRTVRVAKPGVYGLDRDVFIDSDTTLEFAPGTVLKKMKPYQHVLVNRGAYSYGCDSNIVVRNLEISVNKMEKEPDPNSNAPGLNGHVTFYRVKNVTCRNLTCTDFARSQYCYHAVDFDGIVVDGFVIRGGKDGIHLNRGRNFVVRNGVLRTLNAAAADVVKRLGGIATDDLFALLDPLDREQNWSDIYHHKAPVCKKEAEQVAAHVEKGPERK